MTVRDMARQRGTNNQFDAVGYTAGYAGRDYYAWGVKLIVIEL